VTVLKPLRKEKTMTNVFIPGHADDSKTIVFEFLDGLRESGITNMYGAGSYLEDEFRITRKESNSLLDEWMKTFAERHPK